MTKFYENDYENLIGNTHPDVVAFFHIYNDEIDSALSHLPYSNDRLTNVVFEYANEVVMKQHNLDEDALQEALDEMENNVWEDHWCLQQSIFDAYDRLDLIYETQAVEDEEDEE